MEELLWLGLGLFLLFTAFVLPWIQQTRINQMRRELEFLRGGVPIWKLEQMMKQPAPPPAAAAPPQLQVAEPVAATPPAPVPPPPAPKPQRAQKPSRNFEQQFGQRLPIWIGGVALALGGYFLVRYSIEHVLVNPLLRVIAGGMLGAGLVYAAQWLRTHDRLANSQRIAQALAGAGIAVLYLSIFAATQLYALLPPLAGCMAMASITALAVVLALRHGASIALLGMVGGFITPALMATDSPSAPLLFFYLYMLFAGVMLVVKREHWWWLSLPTLGGAFLWTLTWMFSDNFVPGDSIFMGLFLIAISATIVFVTRQDASAEASPLNSRTLLNYAGLTGSLLLSGLIASTSGFTLIEWGMFGALALGGMALSFFNPRQYSFAPFASLAISLVMLSLWHTNDTGAYIAITAAFALLFMAGGYALMLRGHHPLQWALLSAGAATAYFLRAYFTLEASIHLADIPLLWGTLAVVLAVLATYAASVVRETLSDYPLHDATLATFAATATAFVSLALGIELDREFLSVAFAAQMLALAWIYRSLRLPVLRHLVAALAVVFGFLLLPQILLLTQLTVYSLTEAELHLQSTVPIVSWPAFQLGLPAVMFLTAALWLRRLQDSRLVELLEYAALALAATMGYYLMRHAFHTDEDILFVKAGFFERGVITNTLFAYGVGCFVVGRLWNRRAFTFSGMALTAAALFRIFYFDMLSYNPAFVAQEVGGVAVFNSLVLPFGLPLLWSALAAREITARFGYAQFAVPYYTASLLMLFMLLSLNVRFAFHGGEAMHETFISNAEIYSYSLVWLLFGIGLLFAGTLRKHRMLRVASLAVMILTVSKVFLYDASELEGLYRVFSFLGLGVSLLGLSWFYTRFVFTAKEEASNP